MVQRKAATPEAYLAEFPPDRRDAIAAVRQVILLNLPDGYEERMQFGMIGYVVPLSRFPITYNGAPLLYAALAAQKQHVAVYLMDVYADPEAAAWFKRAIWRPANAWIWASPASDSTAWRIFRSN